MTKVLKIGGIGRREALRALVTFAALPSMAALPVAGCAGAQTPEPDDALQSPIEVFEAMLSRLELIESLRVRAVLEYYASDGRVKVRQAVLAKRPGNLRVETMSPFDTTLTVFTTNTTRLAFYDVQAQQFIQGTPSVTNISRFTQFPMTSEDLVRILFGGPPLHAVSTNPDEYSLEWSKRNGSYKLNLPMLTGGALVLFVRHNTWTLSGAQSLDDKGKVQFELRAGEFADVENAGVRVEMPRKIRFLMEEDKVDISLDIESLDLNPDVNDAVFNFTAPAGANIREI